MAGTENGMTEKAAAESMLNKSAVELLAMAEALEWVNTAYHLDIRLQRDLHADARTLRARAETKAAAAPEPVTWTSRYDRPNAPAGTLLHTHPQAKRVAQLEGLLGDLLSEAEFPGSIIDLPRSMIERIRAALEGK